MGFSPETADLLYGMTSLAPSAADALLLSRAVNAEIDFNLLVRAGYGDFVPRGLQATNEVMSTPQALALMREIKSGGPGLSDAKLSHMRLPIFNQVILYQALEQLYPGACL